MAMSASTHTISNKVKPRSEALLIFGAGQVFDRDIGGKPASAFLAVGAVGHDVVRPALSGRTIQIRMVPGIVRQAAALQIGAVPSGDPRATLHQSGKTFRGGRKATGIEVKQVERA